MRPIPPKPFVKPTRKTCIKVRLTDVELEILRHLAHLEGKTMSEFIRSRCGL